MKATIWHNPNCGTSRKTLEILKAQPGLELTVVEYLENPPPRAELERVYARAGLSPRQALRTRGTQAEERGLLSASDAEILDAMAAEPALIERPVVETEMGARLCRPQERVHEIL